MELLAQGSQDEEVGVRASTDKTPLPSADRIAEWKAGAEKVLSDDLPAGHKLWKSWALDLADQVLALAKLTEGERDG